MRFPRRFYDPDDQAQPAAPPPAPSAPEQPAAPPAATAATAAAEHVADATQSATQAAAKTGDDGWKVVADKLDVLSADIRGLTEKLPAAAPAPAPAPKKETPASSAAPAAVAVRPPEKQVKKVWRNGRYVMREVKT